jgi:hypothetical protein
MADSKWQQVKIRIPEIKNWIIHTNATETQIYTRLGISKNTWIKYKREYGILSAALFEARKYRGQVLVPELYDAMLKLALGYEEKEAEVTENEVLNEKNEIKVTRKIVHKKYPPSESAAWKLLKHYTKNSKDPVTDNPMDHQLKVKKLELEKKAQKIKEDNDW